MTNGREADDGGLLPVSPSQTIGPFFHDVVALTGFDRVTAPDGVGERVRIEGRVLDGAGAPVDDALVEIWQPEAVGGHPAGREGPPTGREGPAAAHEGPPARHEGPPGGPAGFARSETVDAGRFSLDAFKPLPEDGVPFIPVRVFARGLLRSLVTRIYFGGESNEDDPVLQAIDPKRRGTLIAERDDASDPPTYRFDIHLQGDRETVFFELQVHRP